MRLAGGGRFHRRFVEGHILLSHAIVTRNVN
jgi:hypothetical protein